MTNLRFDNYQFKIQQKGDRDYVWDIIRKKYILLSPEEKVRQLVIHFLIYSKSISRSLIAIERELDNRTGKRFDIVVFDRDGKPWCLVECKSPQVSLNIDTFLQSAGYNQSLRAPYIWLTNGNQNYVFDVIHKKLLEEFPEF